MIIIEKNTEKILETQPYEMFLRKFEALQIGTSSSLHMQIEPTNKECLEEFKCGFTVDPCYAKRYMLDFQYNSLSEENDRYSLVHCLAFEFKTEFRDMMYDTINDPDIYCILIPILTICWIIAMVVCDVSEEENPIYLFVVAAIQYFAVEYLGIGVFAILLMLMQTISVFTRQNKNADEILLMVFTFIGALYLKVKDFHYIEVTDNNILIGTSTIGLMSRHTWSIIIYILLALSIVLLSILSYITFRKNEKYIRAQIVFTAGIGFILMVLYDIFINTRGYIFDYTTDNVMIRNGVISCMLARGMMMLFAFIVLRIQYNSEPELSEIVIYDEIDLATQIYDEKAELLKKEYTNRIRLYRKSVENILKEKEKTEEEKE